MIYLNLLDIDNNIDTYNFKKGIEELDFELKYI